MVAQANEGRWKIRCFGELRIHRENGELIDWNTKAGATKKLKTIFAFCSLEVKKVLPPKN
jgi:two-component SAPR family response regulator